jgi:hypothetical protein
MVGGWRCLMQASSRVNRIFRDKPGGLVVDYRRSPLPGRLAPCIPS